MAKNPFLLRSVSIVVTAQVHNPSILNPDFLKTKEIVPDSWKVAETITTPPISRVTFENGVSWTVEEPKMTVTQPCASSFDTDYEIYELAVEYVTKLPYVPYRDLGLNCQVTMERRNPDQWVTRRFLKPGHWNKGSPKILSFAPSFLVDADDAQCSLVIQGGKTQDEGKEPEPVVIINCNFHHPGPLAVDALQSAIRRWPERQEFLLDTLNMLLRKR